MKDSPLWPYLIFITSSQALSPNTLTFRVRALSYELGGDGHGHSVCNIPLFHIAHWQWHQRLYCEEEKFFLEVSDRNLGIPWHVPWLILKINVNDLFKCFFEVFIFQPVIPFEEIKYLSLLLTYWNIISFSCSESCLMWVSRYIF